MGGVEGGGGHNYNGIGIDHTFYGDFEVVVRIDGQSYIGGGMIYGKIPQVAGGKDWDTGHIMYASKACGSIDIHGGSTGWGRASWCNSNDVKYTGGYHAPYAGAGAATKSTKYTWFKFTRRGNKLTQEYQMGDNLGYDSSNMSDMLNGNSWSPWQKRSGASGPYEGGSTWVNDGDGVLIALGEAGNGKHKYTLMKAVEPSFCDGR